MSDLRGNNAPSEVSLGSANKIIAAAVLVLGIGAIGAYSVQSGMWAHHPKPAVTDSELPSTR
jgi:hypothetical protein